MVGRSEALEAINDLLASTAIFSTTSSDLLAGVLTEVAGDRLTFAQLKLLRLVERQGRLNIGDVAAFLGISNAAASKAVDRLVRAGLLGRAEAPDDRRATQVSVTGDGRGLLEAFETRSSAALLRLLSGAGLRQLRDLTTSLDRLSVSLAAGRREQGSLCFRCGLYFRDECLLRTSTDDRCYLHLGSGRRREPPAGARRVASGDRVRATTGGIG
ncbi:MAG: MarR family transcriptional regulator [Acidimicrobiia bacterium]|nr:MarR family transcriptional regulator [Acidimicrobiia bacterium]